MTEADKLRVLASFLPEFESPDFNAGREVAPGPTSQGVERLPCEELSAPAERFLATIHEAGWIQTFNWSSWVRTEEARALFEREEAMQAASAEQLSKVLTVCVRRARFDWGASHLEDFRSGLFLRVVQRAAVLAREATD
jgi:hypothetical protein